MNRKALKSGWQMTEEQHRLFWRLWSAAVKCQRWNAQEAELQRRQILSELGFASATHIDSTRGFDAVKERLEALTDRVHNERDDAGERRRLLWNIGNLLSELGEAGYPAHSMDTILRVRFKITEGLRTISDLETRELGNLVKTLKSRLSAFKKRQATTSDAPTTLCDAISTA